MNTYRDDFHEEIIVRANRGTANILYLIVNIFMYIFAIFAVISFQGVLGSIGNSGALPNSIVVFLGFAVLAVGSYFFKDNLKIDYEYTFTNGIVDIAKVKNNKTRKELISFDAKHLEIMAPILTNGFERYKSMGEIAKINAWLNRDREKYFIIVRKGPKKTMIIIEPSEKLIALFKKYNPHALKMQ